mmetsp:Transcript_66358/g.183245  ORF Transcript_66358/g.183245 Transcript_66358/m.183245 type:complete len:335 (+) Transcript_66358:109-1113(+)
MADSYKSHMVDTTMEMADVSQCIILTVAYFLLSWGCHLASAAYSSTIAEYHEYTRPDKQTKCMITVKRDWKEKINWDMNIASGFLSAAMFAMYSYTVCTVLASGEAEERWLYRSSVSTHSLCLHAGVSLYEASTYPFVGKKLEFYVHHVLVLLNCGAFLYTGRGHPWGSFMGLVEGTNIPLCLVMYMRAIPALSDTLAFKLSGAALWLTYLLIRVVLMPFGICLLWQDQHNIPATAFLFADPVNNYAWLCLLYGSGGRLPPLSAVHVHVHFPSLSTLALTSDPITRLHPWYSRSPWAFVLLVLSHHERISQGPRIRAERQAGLIDQPARARARG